MHTTIDKETFNPLSSCCSAALIPPLVAVEIFGFFEAAVAWCRLNRLLYRLGVRSHTNDKMTLTPMASPFLSKRSLVLWRRSGHQNLWLKASMYRARNHEFLRMRSRAHMSE